MDDSRNEAIDYREEFKEFLHKDRFSEYGIERYIDSLDTVVDFYIQVLANPKHKTVFEIADADLLTRYYTILMNDFTFVNQNRAKQKRPTAALLEYIEFVRTRPSPRRPEQKTQPKAAHPESRYASVNTRATRAQLFLQSQRQAIIHQAQAIIRPIEAYLTECRLSSLITFEYHGAIQDVDVLSPRFKNDISTEARELGEMVSLMEKYEVAVPPGVRRRYELAREQKELRDNIRAFENWLVAYMTYLPTTGMEVHSIQYTPDAGFKVSLSDRNRTSVVVKI